MKAIIGYLRQYFIEASIRVHLLCVVFTTLLVVANFGLGLNRWLYALPQPLEFIGWYLLLLLSFAVPYLFYFWLDRGAIVFSKHFVALLLLAPFVFAWKMSAPLQLFTQGSQAVFWSSVIYYPLKGLVVTGMLLMLRNLGGKDPQLMGLRSPVTKMRPYFIMLALMVPLVFAAATQPDFLRVYPKVQHLLQRYPDFTWIQVLMYELAYGSDFFTIELFFRGFLVIYLARWAGQRSILPAAVLYCIIHIGKPLGECISSFFGGMLLGIVSYRTQSIWGGLVVHLGIAWLMELAGWYPLSP